MAETLRETGRGLRISAAEARQRLASGEAALILDVRSQRAWKNSDVQLPGAIRRMVEELRPDPSWPRERLTLTYCT
jgi:hypothetical protein